MTTQVRTACLNRPAALTSYTCTGWNCGDGPPYRSLQHLARWGVPGRGVRRWLEPALNSPSRAAARRERFLDSFFAALADYKTGGGRLVYTLHNWGQHEGEGERIEQAALDRLLQLADAVHVHADYIVPELQARLPAGASPVVTVIPHGNYIGAYPNTLDRSAARQRLAVPGRRLCLPLLRVDPSLQRAGRAAAGLCPGRRPASAPADRRPVAAARLRRPACRHASDDPRVHWHPQFVANDDVQVWMNAADVVVLPYRRITTSGAAMLAWSFGKPVIAPRLPAFVELMDKAPFLGILYDPANPAALQEALQQATTIDWQAHRPSILAWAEQFSWQRIARQFATLYEQDDIR